jgi:hypothetical protein
MGRRIKRLMLRKEVLRDLAPGDMRQVVAVGGRGSEVACNDTTQCLPEHTISCTLCTFPCPDASRDSACYLCKGDGQMWWLS